MHIIGTAGHVDHGKSTLLRALTGMEPDRLPEEKKRGMTIDLNFVWTHFGEEPVGFIDVPGHSRFVKNMITGAAAIDAFLFVVAADDGWMPQSEEHLRVLRHLKVERGVLVLSKIDRVRPEMLAQVEAEVRARFEGLDVPLLHFKKGDDIAPVRTSLEKALKSLPAPTANKAPRIWVDRVFHPQGQGTVITGSLREGALKPGDTLHVSPSGETVTIRQIQQYGSPVLRAEPISRVALQLSASVERGCLLEGVHGSEARVVDVSVECFEPLRPRNQHLQFHIGTTHRKVLFIPLDAERARLKFEEPIRLRVGDRFLLRTPGEERTLAGGTIIDSEPRERSHKKAKEALRGWKPGLEGSVRCLLARQGVLDLSAFERNSVWSAEEISVFLKAPEFLRVGETLVLDRLRTEKVISLMQRELRKAHGNGKEGLSIAELRKISGLPPRALDCVIRVALHLKKMEKVSDRFREAGHRPAPLPWEKEALALLKPAALAGKPFALKDLPYEEERLRMTAERYPDRFVALDPGYFISGPLYRKFTEKVIEHLRAHEKATSGELKALLGLSRKPAVMILERMDRDRMTYLKGGVRRLLSK